MHLSLGNNSASVKCSRPWFGHPGERQQLHLLENSSLGWTAQEDPQTKKEPSPEQLLALKFMEAASKDPQQHGEICFDNCKGLGTWRPDFYS